MRVPRRSLPTFALAFALPPPVPARAAGIRVASTQEGGDALSASGIASARLQGVLSGSASGPLLPDAEGQAVVLPRIVLDGGPTGRAIYALDPIPVAPAARIRFTAAVDVALDLTGFSSLAIRPDFVFARGTSPFDFYTEAGSFTGTLTTADAGGAVLADAPGSASSTWLAAARRRMA